MDPKSCNVLLFVSFDLLIRNPPGNPSPVYIPDLLHGAGDLPPCLGMKPSVNHHSKNLV